jgi:hypothetical protein
MPIGSPQWMYASGEDFTIDQSLRFSGGVTNSASSYLSFTPASAGNRRTWTLSCWVKKAGHYGTNTHGYMTILAQNDGSSQNGEIYFNATSDWGGLYWHLGNTDNIRSYTSARFRDPSAWYHLVFTLDTTQSTAANRQRFYVNGEQLTDFDGYAPTPSQNYEGNINKAAQHEIGCRDGTHNFFDGYMAEMHFIDGTALTPSSFGETGDYGEWKPIEVSGLTYGTNGFYLDFANKSTKHTLTANGNAQHDTAQQKIGATSIAFDGTGDYVQILNTGSSFDFGTSDDFTLECWVRPADVTGGQSVIDIRGSHGDYIQLYFSGSGVAVAGGNVNISVVSSAVSANTWYHFAVVRSGGTITLYKDGTSIGTPDTSTGQIGGTDYSVAFGMYRTNAGGGGEAFNGFIDEIRISDSARYTGSFTPSTSAFTDDDDTLLLVHSDTSDASTTFTDSSGTLQGLGTDAAGSNHFTAHNSTAADQMLDTPTNNFATVNPIFRGSAMSGQSATLYNYLAEGNLRIKPEHNQWIGMTMFPQTGKWYAEAYCFGTSPYGPMIGFYGDAYNRTDFNPEFGSMYKLYSRGASDELIWYAEPASAVSLGASSGTAFDVGDIFGMAWDCDSGKMWISHNNTWYNASLGTTGNPSTGANPMATATATERAGGFGIYVGSGDEYGGDTEGAQMIMNFGQDSSFAGEKTAQGNQDANSIGDFYYTPPTGFLALCTSNLPEPAVIPSEHFNTVLYTGNGGTNAITGVGFQPDWVWAKKRSAAGQHFLFDAVRGADKQLKTASTLAETSHSNYLASFDTDGFTFGSDSDTNGNTLTFVAWNWKAASTASGTTTGSGTGKAYSARYNTDAGFSIITYEGNDTAGHTIPHHLSKAPEWFMIKAREHTDPWCLFHHKLHPSTPEQYADEMNAIASFHNSDYWNDTAPTSSVFTVGSSNNINGNDVGYIAYCFHSVEGFSKVGTYEGNDNADGTFVYTGFRPAYVWIKNIDASSNWVCRDNTRDTYNPSTRRLLPNLTAYERTDLYGILDFTSNGFKLRDGDNLTNEETYIYFAIAETPFKYSNAK